ncbi:hypothetical protein H9Q70_013970 [Fusarium xylarioides]|nr:hypothetical protein H9Q70_013970 [Fusarium xylarioides]KAG5769224.1 hypothetical protein H9Q73_013635 [Fusarium xylarioides]
MTGFSISSSLALVVALLGIAKADGQYRSRPDLAPPQLNITIPATEHVSPGYIFVGPYPGFDGVRAGPEQAAAYIFTNTGDLVWSSLGHFAGWVGNFQAVRYRGKPALQAFQGYLGPLHGHGYGTPILLDDHYQPLALVQTPNHRLISIHEFKIVNEETALVEIYQPTAMDLGPFGASVEEQWIVDGVFQEFDIASGELLFEGHTLDWASPADSIIPLRSGRAFTGTNASDAWDYFHINSVDKNDQGDYLISGRHMSALYKINGSDGSLLWQLGGRKSTISHPDFDFGYQHDARFLNRSEDGSVETIPFSDNSARSDRQRTGGVDRLHPHSRARIVEINHNHNTARELSTFTPPDYLSAPSQGNVQVLGNQNVFVNWGQAGAVTEFSPDGTPIFHAYLESGELAPGVQSYRGFRCEWTGYSRETPAVVAYADGSELSLYASWNGDTATAAWRFYSQCTTERRQRGGGYETRELGQVARKSFETSLVVSINQLRGWSKDCGIFAQAVDSSGNLLSTSRVVSIAHSLPQPPSASAPPSPLEEFGQKALWGFLDLNLFPLLAVSAVAEVHYLFSGFFSGSIIAGIEFDDEAHSLSLVKNISSASDDGSKWIALDACKKNLYVGTTGYFQSYKITKDLGLTYKSNVSLSSDCNNANFITASSKSPFAVFGTPYGGGCPTVAISVDKTGTLQKSFANATYNTKGGVHGTVLSPKNDFLYSADDMGNAVWVHSYDRETGKIEGVQYLAADEGSNPRHLTVHPNGKWVYVVYEEANSIAAYQRNTKTSKLEFRNETYSLLPSGFTNSSSYWADEVLLSTPAEGTSPKYLLAATRSRKTGVPGYVSAFSLDAETGGIREQLFLQETTNSGGSANAVSPASFSEDLFAITDSGSNFIEVWKIKGKNASAVAHLDLANGPANAVWYN